MAVSQQTFIKIGGTDTQRTIKSITIGVAGIGVQCKVEFKRHSKSGICLVEY